MHVSVDAARCRFPPPPRWAQRFRSDSLDEVRAFVTRAHAEHSRIAHGTGPLRFEFASATGIRVGLGWASAGLPQTIRGALPYCVVHVPTGQRNHYLLGRRQVATGPGAALFIPAGWEFTRRGSAGTMFAIAVEHEALTAELAARHRDGDEKWALGAHPFEPIAAERSAFDSAIAELVGSLGPEADAIRRGHCEARVISVLADVAQRELAAAPAARLAGARLADLEAWIDAHLAEPLTLGRLCEVSGAGARSLQFVFQSHRGLSPMRFVTERRLAAARRLLARAGPGDDVTRIAVGVGFTHLGRFSVLYRQTYGESPSQTLVRGAGPAAPVDRAAANASAVRARRIRPNSLSG